MKYLLIFIFIASLIEATAAEQVVVERSANPSQVILVSMTGITGLAQEVIKFDLEVAGFEFVNADRAMFHVSGTSGAKLAGILTDRNKTPLLNRNYGGPDPRIVAH